MKALVVFASVASLCLGLLDPGAARAERAPASGHEGLPTPYQATTRDHFSSGALRLLDRGGNLIQPPVSVPRSVGTGSSWCAEAPSAASAATPASASDPAILAGLDPRVGFNLRLGDDPNQLPSTLRAQAEPHIARHPAQPDVLVATFQEGRFTDAGAVDCGYAISHDGGLTWKRALIPGLTAITGGPYYRASDPVAGIDFNGVFYLETIALLDSTLLTTALLLSRSTNGGASFEPPVEIMRSPDNSVFLDKGWMAINTFTATRTAGRVVLTLTRFYNSYNPIVSTFSDDAGKTWSPGVFATPSNYLAQGSQPLFLPNGNLAVVYWNFQPSDRLEVALSTNGGASFDSPRLITLPRQYYESIVRSGSFVPSAVSDRSLGQIYVTYQDYSEFQPRINFTKSIDGGTSWTPPIAISDNPINSPVFNPAIAASPDGQVLSVVFYDGRVNPGNTYLVDLFLAQSFDGGATWAPNIRLTSVSTDVRLAPLTTTGYMLGDYLGIAPSTGQDVPAVPVWVDTRTGNPDPFIARVGLAPQVTFASWRAARFSLAQINDPLRGPAGADPDHDGVINLLEYVFALNAFATDKPVFGAGFSGGGAVASFTSTYERVSGASDVVYSW